MSIRNTFPAKQNFSTIGDLTAIILCAGKGRRTSSIGNKSMVKINDTNLINHQISVLKNRFPGIFDIVTVLGFDYDRICKTLPSGIRVVENENFENTNVSRSISIGLRAARSENVFIIYGDILFDDTVFNNFSTNSCIAIDTFGKINDSKIGVTIENNRVINLAYGLENGLWAQFGFFRGYELDLIRKITYDRNNDPLCGYEILNKVLQKGGKLEAVSLEKKSILTEFNSIQDMKNAKEMF